MSAASFNRAGALERLRCRVASRGLRTALVEAGDFASGAPSRSSKMVHGGFRYLQQGDVGLLFQALVPQRMGAGREATAPGGKGR